jgi:hypothetical protein
MIKWNLGLMVLVVKNENIKKQTDGAKKQKRVKKVKRVVKNDVKKVEKIKT